MEVHAREGEDDDRQPLPRTAAMALRIPHHADGPREGISRRLPERRSGPSSSAWRPGRQARPMKDNDALRRLAATGIFLLTSVMIVGALLVWLWRGSPPQPAGFVQGTLGVAGVTLTGLVYGTAGLLIVRRSARNAMGWLFLAIAIGMAIVLPISQLVETTVHPFR